MSFSDLLFYVYILFDWRGIPRYVGKGKDGTRREYSHERNTDQVNWMKNEFIEQTWIMFGEIPKIIVRNNLSEGDAFLLESSLIKTIRRYPNGPLTNMTDGGEGRSGYKLSTKSRKLLSLKAKIREANKTEEQRLIIKEKFLNTLHSRYTPFQLSERAKMGNAYLTEEERANLADRLNSGLNFEQRSLRLRIAFSKMDPEIRKKRAIAGGVSTSKLLTPEEQSRRATKGKLKNSQWHKGRRWINNGVVSRQSKDLPEGWVYGRLINR